MLKVTDKVKVPTNTYLIESIGSLSVGENDLELHNLASYNDPKQAEYFYNFLAFCINNDPYEYPAGENEDIFDMIYGVIPYDGPSGRRGYIDMVNIKWADENGVLYNVEVIDNDE
jgi:hypothetical protein